MIQKGCFHVCMVTLTQPLSHRQLLCMCFCDGPGKKEVVLNRHRGGHNVTNSAITFLGRMRIEALICVHHFNKQTQIF